MAGEMITPPPPMLAQAPAQNPLGGQDPRSQYLAAAIQALQSRGAGGSPQGLGEGLLSQMLLKKAYQGNQGQQGGGMQGDANDPGMMGSQQGMVANQGPDSGGGIGNPSIFGMGQTAAMQALGSPTMQGMNNGNFMQGQGGWPFGGG